MYNARGWTSKSLPPLKNPLLRREREEKERRRQASLRRVRSVVDTGVPRTYVMRKKQKEKTKRQQGQRYVVGLTKDRLKDIEKQNKLLLQRMVKIATDDANYKKHPVPRQRESTYQVNRRVNMKRINRGNMKLLERLVEQQVQPGEFSVERLRSEEKQRVKLLRHMCAYPYHQGGGGGPDEAGPAHAAPRRSSSTASLPAHGRAASAAPAQGGAGGGRARARSRPQSRAGPASRRPQRSAGAGRKPLASGGKNCASTPALRGRRRGAREGAPRGGGGDPKAGGASAAASSSSSAPPADAGELQASPEALLQRLRDDWDAYRAAADGPAAARPFEEEREIFSGVREVRRAGRSGAASVRARVRVAYHPRVLGGAEGTAAAAGARPGEASPAAATAAGGEPSEAAAGQKAATEWCLEVTAVPAGGDGDGDGDGGEERRDGGEPGSAAGASRVVLGGYHVECSLQAFPALLRGEHAADLAEVVLAFLAAGEDGELSVELSAVSSLGLQLQIKERLSTVASGKPTHLRPRRTASRPSSRLSTAPASPATGRRAAAAQPAG